MKITSADEVKNHKIYYIVPLRPLRRTHNSKQRKQEIAMVKSPNNETTIVKSRKYDDKKSKVRWCKAENTKRRWLKTGYNFVFSPSYFDISPSWFSYFDFSPFQHCSFAFLSDMLTEIIQGQEVKGKLWWWKIDGTIVESRITMVKISNYNDEKSKYDADKLK
jgi:hypothetical protein